MKYPIYKNITVKLVGEDGNAFSIIARVRKAMRSKNIPEEKIADFVSEATSGDYNKLLATVGKYVKVK